MGPSQIVYYMAPPLIESPNRPVESIRTPHMGPGGPLCQQHCAFLLNVLHSPTWQNWAEPARAVNMSFQGPGMGKPTLLGNKAWGRDPCRWSPHPTLCLLAYRSHCGVCLVQVCPEAPEGSHLLLPA